MRQAVRVGAQGEKRDRRDFGMREAPGADERIVLEGGEAAVRLLVASEESAGAGRGRLTGGGEEQERLRSGIRVGLHGTAVAPTAAGTLAGDEPAGSAVERSGECLAVGRAEAGEPESDMGGGPV